MCSHCLLYYITDRKALAPAPLGERIREAIGAGIDLVQIREKDLPTRQLVTLVQATVAAAQGTATRIIVNDRLDVALAVGAAGVHLGGQSVPPEAVRQVVPRDFLVGVSCHSPADAHAAESAGADYVVFGPVYSTPSKLVYGPPLGVEKLREAAASVKIPVFALGGVTVERAGECLAAGAGGIAGISIFQSCDSLQARVSALRAVVVKGST